MTWEVERAYHSQNSVDVICQKSSKSVDVCGTYSKPKECFLATQCTLVTLTCNCIQLNVNKLWPDMHHALITWNVNRTCEVVLRWMPVRWDMVVSKTIQMLMIAWWLVIRYRCVISISSIQIIIIIIIIWQLLMNSKWLNSFLTAHSLAQLCHSAEYINKYKLHK